MTRFRRWTRSPAGTRVAVLEHPDQHAVGRGHGEQVEDDRLQGDHDRAERGHQQHERQAQDEREDDRRAAVHLGDLAERCGDHVLAQLAQRAHRGRVGAVAPHRDWRSRRPSRPGLVPMLTGPFMSSVASACLRGCQRAGKGNDSPRGDPMRVVVADDSVLLREGIARLLEDAGIEVVGQVGDGEALERRSGTTSRTSRSSTSGCRPPHRRGAPRRAERSAKSTGRRGAGALPLRRDALRPASARGGAERRRLPAQGPGRRRRRASSTRSGGSPRRFGARPGRRRSSCSAAAGARTR